MLKKELRFAWVGENLKYLRESKTALLLEGVKEENIEVEIGEDLHGRETYSIYVVGDK